MRSYAQWLSQVPRHDPTPELVAETADRPDRFPSFSVLVPTWNTREDLLRACLDSVLTQSYPHWQLVVADDASTQPHVAKVLLEYAARDDRVEVVFCTEHGHISATTNAALARATRMYVAFLDHDDLLDQHALYHMARAIQAHPSADILYSDEDIITDSGAPHSAHLKSAWNYDLLLSNNYICHLAVYESSLVNCVGGLRLGVEGSQDHDLLLRCVPLVKAENILHIPRVLYHWRRTPGSAAHDPASKPYTQQAGTIALADHLSGVGASVAPGPAPNTYRITWPLPTRTPLVSLLLLADTEADRRQVPAAYHPVPFHQVELLTAGPGGSMSERINGMAAQAQGKILVLVSPGLDPLRLDWLEWLLRQAWRPDVGAVGAKLLKHDRTIQHGGYLIGMQNAVGSAHQGLPANHSGHGWRLHLPHQVSAVSGACLAIGTATFHEVGGLDAKNFPHELADVDLCLRLGQAGYRQIWEPRAELIWRNPERRVYRRPDLPPLITTAYLRLKELWAEQLDDDPFYHPYLGRARGDFSLADPSTLDFNPQTARMSAAP